MKAIITKFLPPTNTLPTRIKASAEGVKSKIFHRGELRKVGDEIENEHVIAAKLFAASRDWPTNLASGGLPDGSWAHCFIR